MPRHDKYLSSDDEADRTTDDNMDCLFDDRGDETDITTDYDIDSFLENSDDDANDEASLFDGEELHPPEYYLNGAANLDPQRLRQKRYKNKTQDRLDWVKEHCTR
jgi:hypothetical protein